MKKITQLIEDFPVRRLVMEIYGDGLGGAGEVSYHCGVRRVS